MSLMCHQISDGDPDLLVECPDDLGVEVAPAVVCLLPFLDLSHHWTLQRDLSKKIGEIPEHNIGYFKFCQRIKK